MSSTTVAEARRPAEPPVAEFKPPAFAPAREREYNRTGIDFHQPMPRPKVRGPVVDFHCHLLAARHAKDWFDTADHFGLDRFVTMTPLEEAVGIQRLYPGRVQFIVIPQWQDKSPQWIDNWIQRLEGFYNIGSRLLKFHCAPGTMVMRGIRLDDPKYRPVFREIIARKMAVMTHIGDPDLWYHGKYTDVAKYGTRDEHYKMWESMLIEYPHLPWIGAHLGGNPENLPRLQDLLDRFPNVMLDCSATRWMAREISNRRDAARDFFIHNQDRILFGSDQVSGDDRKFDFLASRWWTHRKLWETAYIGPSPILDPDLSEENQPVLRGLALPDEVLQKIYHDNAIRFLTRIGAVSGGWEEA